MSLRHDRRGWVLMEAIMLIVILGVVFAVANNVLIGVRKHRYLSDATGETQRLASSIAVTAQHDICVDYLPGNVPRSCFDLAQVLYDSASSDASLPAGERLPILYTLTDNPFPGTNENPRDYFVLSPEPDRTGANRCQAVDASHNEPLSLETRRDVSVQANFQRGLGAGTRPIVRTATIQTTFAQNDIAWFGVPVPSGTPADEYADDTSAGTLVVRVAPIDSNGHRIFSSLQYEFYADQPGPDGCYIAVVPQNAAVAYRDHHGISQVCIMTFHGASRRC